MLNTLMVILLLHYLYLYIFKPKLNSFQCGIFGQSTNTPKKLNQSNVKILGMFNESRGKHSCGITYDGEVYHGIDDTKLFTDFMKHQTFDAKAYPLMFGHTRQSSVGVINNFNCHPFAFGINKKETGYKFIGVHNGTLLNYEELAEKYEIDLNDEYLDKQGDTRIRRKIDSEILLEIIYKTKNLKVLSDYNGKAALVWTDTDMPDTIYLWSGKSKPCETSPLNLAEEERPMIVYVENKNSFYFSSLKESLYAIGGNDKNTFQIEYNTVYIVKNGNFRGAKTFRVSRKNNYNSEGWGKNSAYGGNNSAVNQISNAPGRYREALKEYALKKKNNEIENSVPLLLNSGENWKMPEIKNIYQDKSVYDVKVYKNKTYTKHFRYYRSGSLLEGIFIYIAGFGFYDLGQTSKAADEMFECIIGLDWIKEEEEFDFVGTFRGMGKVLYHDVNIKPIYHYIIEGVLVKDRLDYEVLREDKLKNAEDLKNTYYDHNKLSYMTIHPVIDLRQTSKEDGNQEIYKDGRLFTGEVDGLCFEKRYHVTRGNLKKVVYKDYPSSSPIPKVVDLFEKTSIIGIDKNDVKNPINISLPFNSKVLDLSENFIENMEDSILRSEGIDPADNDEFEEEMNWQEQHELNRSKEKTLEVKDAWSDAEFLKNLEETDMKNDELAEKNDIDSLIYEKLNEHLADTVIAFQECKKEIIELNLGDNPTSKEAILLLDNMSGFLDEYLRKTERK